MGELKHDNHVVPQFYLREWTSDDSKLDCHNRVYKKFDKSFDRKYSSEIGFIKDTYSDELEDMFSDFENSFSSVYRNIMDILTKNVAKSVVPFVFSDKDMEINLMKFVYLQSIRTINGRLSFSGDSNAIYDAKSMLETAEQYNDRLQEKVFKVLNNQYKIFYEGFYRIVFYIDDSLFNNGTTFWTSTNPVHYADINRLRLSAMKYDGLERDANMMICPLSPRFMLCLIKSNLFVMPMDLSAIFTNLLVDRCHSVKIDDKQFVDDLNISILQGIEPCFKATKDNRFRDHINFYSCFYYVMSLKFTESDKFLLNQYKLHPDEKSKILVERNFE